MGGDRRSGQPRDRRAGSLLAHGARSEPARRLELDTGGWKPEERHTAAAFRLVDAGAADSLRNDREARPDQAAALVEIALRLHAGDRLIVGGMGVRLHAGLPVRSPAAVERDMLRVRLAD